jgi:hypothetical protein
MDSLRPIKNYKMIALTRLDNAPAPLEKSARIDSI